jgi:hypothetical protein
MSRGDLREREALPPEAGRVPMSRWFIAAVAVVVASFAPVSVANVAAQTEAVVTPLTDAVATAASMQFSTIDQSGLQVSREMARPAGSQWASSVLTAMQVTTFAAQALDVHSTIQALNAGAVEANPMLKGVVKNKLAFIGVKAAIGSGMAFATHRMAKRNKVAAILTAAATNSVYLYVAHHNYKLAKSLR